MQSTHQQTHKDSRILDISNKLLLNYYHNQCLKNKPSYHPLPWVGVTENRSMDCSKRLNALLRFLKKSKIKSGTVLDVGCNLGFFSLSFKEKDFCVYGVEKDSLDLAIAKSIGDSIKKGNFFPINMCVNERTVENLPSTDICLCLSIWYIWVKELGLKNATTMLRSLFKKTNKILFFETETLTANADHSIIEYLTQTLKTNHIHHLGKYLPEASHDQKTYQRELFAILKK